MLAGQPLVLWRRADGRVQVWQDRCPHRGVRLSLGFVREDTFGCPYHGWRFDPDGRCVFIPANPELSGGRSIRVQRFEAVEDHALIWISAEEERPTGPVVGTPLPPLIGIRTVTVPVPVAAVRARVDGLAAPGADGAPQWDGPLAIIRCADDLVTMAVAPFDADHTSVHLCVSATATVERRIELGRFAAQLRDVAIAPVAV